MGNQLSRILLFSRCYNHLSWLSIMVKLDQIKKDAVLSGIVPGQSVKIASVDQIGDDAVSVFYRDSQGKLGERMLFRSDEASLDHVELGRPWSFDGNAADFKLAAEAHRIQLAHLFDPLMAVHTSTVEPLPHQITAVYESMLPKQPLRFLLADDPGSGKTIMAGLLVRELMVRGDLKRCLIVAPGNLVEQWQDELDQKFGLSFNIFSREMLDVSRTGNPFDEHDQLIARIDQLARAEDLHGKLQNSDWDLIIVDEAHKMSASWFGSKLNKTKRYQLGELLGRITRHLLLMTATPHNGKEEDFQTFLALLDSDRFYGKFRDGTHQVDTSDLMRRMIKEELLKFDATPLFPERRAYTVNYQLSPLEAALYTAVTEYVRNEMNRAQNLDGNRKGTVGFALTILQRRLASSPEAIYQSLKRRHKKLLRMLEEVKLQKRGLSELGNLRAMTEDEVNDFLDDAPDQEIEEVENQVLDQATAAQTIAELEAEIASLELLVEQARTVRQAEEDRKWLELSKLLQDNPHMRDRFGERRKLIIFTEHKDTLSYLYDRITSLLGCEDGVVLIHGSVKREERRKVQEQFTQDKQVVIMIATDAAGEGINLQRGNLMINYDLPWNPNRLEQRFGRIHRIGQTEVCHLWNMVANETREGDVFQRLFEKLEQERETLGGKVFDILGQVFENYSLRDLLMEAILYGDSEDVRARLHQKVADALDTEHLREIMQRNALSAEHLDISRVFHIKEEMEKAEALKLQPYFIYSFFQEAFVRQGGQLKQREVGRYEISHVPATIRSRDRVIGYGKPVLRRYERICFHKDKTRVVGRPLADLIAPGHPLMDATLDLVQEQYRNVLKQGTVFIDRADEGTIPHVLYIIDHTIRDGGQDKHGRQRIISQRMQFVLIDESGAVSQGGHAPYLDYEEPDQEELVVLSDILHQPWLMQNMETPALAHAVKNLVPDHFNDVKDRREHMITATLKAVHERLTKEINYWSYRYEKLLLETQAGKQPRMQPENARRRAEELTERLQQRTRELEDQRHVVSNTPLIVGGALIIPQGLLNQHKGQAVPYWAADPVARAKVEKHAMDAVMAAERALGHEPHDVSMEKHGWDILSRTGNGEVRFIEVKGRVKGAPTITVTKNEILASLNQPERYILAIVMIDGNDTDGPWYLRTPFDQEPGFGVTSINYNIQTLLDLAEAPS
jgi:superfamily II DNA or RNA helicase